MTHFVNYLSTGIIARYVGDVSYILLGFVLSAIMFQLSVSLSLILNMIDLEEANAHKFTFNICITFICVVYIGFSITEVLLDKQ